MAQKPTAPKHTRPAANPKARARRRSAAGQALPSAPPAPPPEQLNIDRHAAVRQQLASHVATVQQNIGTDITAARRHLMEIQSKAWKLGLERRRLLERVAEIDLDLREAERAEKIEEGAIGAHLLAQSRVQPPPGVA